MMSKVLPFVCKQLRLIAAIGLVSVVACSKIAPTEEPNAERKAEESMTRAGYTFVSVSTAEPGRLDELARIASAPSEKMDGKVPGLLARQVGVDRDRNTVVVWVTFDRKQSLSAYLETEEGKNDHGENDDMSSVATFEMYDLTPVSGRIPGLAE